MQKGKKGKFQLNFTVLCNNISLLFGFRCALTLLNEHGTEVLFNFVSETGMHSLLDQG